MDLAATQIYEDEDFPSTQRISHVPEEERSVQVGILSIQSTEYQIKKGITKIGRLNNSDIAINDTSVSKIHAEIEASTGDGSTWICDLHSSNKTKLNNLILRPSRSYELNDGSVIEFGKVRATYRTYRPRNDTVIPETPAPMRPRVMKTIIPNTPDSSLNNSSGVDDDGSVILGTQKDDENNTFRRPLDPQQHQSTNIGKRSISGSSVSTNDNSQVAALLHVSDVDISQNREVSIFDMDTQKFGEGYEISTSIHNIETQKFPTQAPESLKTNTTSNKQLSKNDIRDELAKRSSRTNIHDMETQNYVNDDKMNKECIRSNRADSRDVATKKLTMDIHDVETQNYINSTAEDDIETQKFETNGNKTQMKDIDQVECNIHNLETQLDKVYSAEGIHDMETQLVSNDSVNETNNNPKNSIDESKNKDNILDAIKNGTSYENNTKLSSSKSSSPASLNLSSPGIDEECPSSLLDESVHLLESSSLLEYFSEGIDKQEKIQASTPKLHSKTHSTERHSNDIRNMSNASDNTDDNDEDNIFDVPTQRINHKLEDLLPGNSENDEGNSTIYNNSKKKPGMSQLTNSDDSETDAEDYIEELTKKQRKSLEVSNETCNESAEDRNEPSTSVDSDDMFDMPTQRLKDFVAKNTSNSSINQLQKTNKIVIDDTAPTQLTNNIRDTTAPTQIINTNPDCEDVDYEMAPTQVISELEDGEKGNSVRNNLDREKAVESPKVDLNDTLEQNLNEMFDDVNNDNIQEPPQISTQNLEDILESSQNDNDLYVKSTVNTNNIPCTQSEKKSRYRSSRNQPRNGTNEDDVDKEEVDSQNSDVYFATMATKRKRNIMTDTQELPCTMEKSSRQDNANSSRKSEEKTKNESTKHKKKRRRIIKSRHRSTVSTDDLNKDNISKTISSENNERNVEKSELMKQKGGTASEMNEQVLAKDSCKVDDTEKNLASSSNIYEPYPLENEQCAQMSNTSHENDDDILIHLPAVRISGTFSNPPSPSVSSTSTASVKSKKDVTKRKSKRVESARAKSLRERTVENSEKDNKPSGVNDKPSIPLTDKSLSSSIPPTLKTKKPSQVTNSSDSDSEMSYKRFKQMADRMLNNELNYVNKRSEGNVQSTNKSVTSNKKKSAPSSPDISKSSMESSDAKRSKNSLRTNPRLMRYYNRQNKDSLCVLQVMEDMHEKNETDTSTKFKTGSTAPNRKRSFHAVEQDAEQTKSKRRKADRVIKEHPVLIRSRRSAAAIVTNRQSPNILKYSAKTSSQASSLVIRNTRFFKDRKSTSEIMLKKTPKASLNSQTDGNVDIGKSNVKRTRRKINDDQVATRADDVIAIKNSNRTKQGQAKKEKTGTNLTHGKVLKIVLDPLVIGDESQEVMMIMKKAPSNAPDKNLLIKEKSNARTLQRELRNIRGKKQSNTDNEVDSVSAESGSSFDIDDSDSMQLDNIAPKAKRGSPVKNVIPLQIAQASEKKEAFKKPARIDQNSVHSIFDSSTENITDKDSQGSAESNTLSNPRLSRSKAANIKKTEKIEVNQNTRRDRTTLSSSSGIGTSMKITSIALTPSKTRRSVSISSNPSPSTSKHRILFTGITSIREDKYSKVIRTLGGNKVEDPAKCTVLVTDKVRRTYKFLCALARGIPIVAIDWLRDSESAAQFLDWNSYILKDPVAEAKFGFRLRKSLDKAKKKKLLDGYTVILTPGVASPPVEEVKNMVTSCGGKALLRPPIKWSAKTVIISREEDLSNAKKFLAKAPNIVTVQSTEFILTGILRQETDFDKYKLM